MSPSTSLSPRTTSRRRASRDEITWQFSYMLSFKTWVSSWVLVKPCLSRLALLFYPMSFSKSRLSWEKKRKPFPSSSGGGGNRSIPGATMFSTLPGSFLVLVFGIWKSKENEPEIKEVTCYKHFPTLFATPFLSPRTSTDFPTSSSPSTWLRFI